MRPFDLGVDVQRGALGKARALVSGLARLDAWLRRELPAADAVLAWFADYHTARITSRAARLGVPVLMPLGGYDAMRIPALGYGVFASRWRAGLARAALRRATVLLPVSASLVSSRNDFGDVGWQGVDVFAPGHAPAALVPTGYDAGAWPLGPDARAPSVLSVATVDSHTTFRRKGLDLLIEVARRVPDVPFEIVGLRLPEDEVRARYAPPSNVALTAAVPREALAERYGAASVYLQLSRAEGMPNVVCEAMLCGAVPVGSAAFGIPDAIGEAGFVVPREDPGAIAATVRKALRAPASLRHAGRAHVATWFPRARRRWALERLLGGTVGGEDATALAAEVSAWTPSTPMPAFDAAPSTRP